MTLDAVLDKIEAIIEGTHYGASPLEMGHCEYCCLLYTSPSPRD